MTERRHKITVVSPKSTTSWELEIGITVAVCDDGRQQTTAFRSFHLGVFALLFELIRGSFWASGEDFLFKTTDWFNGWSSRIKW